jgi:uncharacterized membrane protein required for colicin V production
MAMKNLPISWVDLVTIAVLVVGFIRGRKRGMSEELLDVFQWLLAVFIAGLAYDPFGDILFNYINFFSLLVSRILAYILIVIGVQVFFIILKRVVGEKLVGSDLFGRLEYYLGMIAGMLRFACMLFIVYALVHSREYTQEERDEQAKDQERDFGTITLPSWSSLQEEIFKRSISGQFVHKHLKNQLIKPTHYDARIKDDGWGRKKEKEIEDLMKPKK